MLSLAGWIRIEAADFLVHLQRAPYPTPKRYDSPSETEADICRHIEAGEVVIGFGHTVYTARDQRNGVNKSVTRQLLEEAKSTKMFVNAHQRLGRACD